MADAQQNTPFSGNGPSDANQPFPQQNGQYNSNSSNIRLRRGNISSQISGKRSSSRRR